MRPLPGVVAALAFGLLFSPHPAAGMAQAPPSPAAEAAAPASTAAPPGMSGVAPEDVRAVEASLICQCGCGMVVKECECSWAAGARADFAARLGAGQTREQILADYVAAYGETVLAAPTKKGFNLAAWILPFAAVLAGGVVITLFVRRWAASGYRAPDEAGSPLNETERRLLEERLAREMKDYL